MSNYVKMTDIEKKRQQSDLMYHIIVNSRADTLNDVCNQIKTYIIHSYKEENMSTRLKQILNKICQNDDRVAKHALVFFALSQETEIQNIFIQDTPKVPPEKFKFFIDHELPQLLEKLVKGAFTSLRAFVEDSRWAYTSL